MNKFIKNNSDYFNLLRKIDKNNKSTQSQRNLAKELGFSLGKFNYCFKALEEKWLVKIRNLQKQKNRMEYIRKYVLTSEGIKLRTRLTLEFMKRKIDEYNELKKELKLERKKKIKIKKKN